VTVERRILREHQSTGRPLQGHRPALTHQRLQGQAQQLTAQVAALLRGQGDEQGHGAPLHVRLWDHEDDAPERERGRGL
jgi:hypothetical protein